MPAEERAAVRDRVDQFRLLVETVRDYAIFLLDSEGYVRSWNAGAERIKGYAAQEIIGKHFSTFYPAADLEAGKPAEELRVAALEGRYEDEGWRVRKDGTTFWANVVITALRDPGGRLVGFAKVTRDLTERKRNEERLLALVDSERSARMQSEATLEELRKIQSVTEAALAYLGLDDLLSALLDRVTTALSVDTAAVLLIPDGGDALVARAAHGIEEEVERGIRIPIGSGFAGKIAAERRAIVLDDVEHANVLNPILREKGIRSLMGVPLISEARVVGVLHVGSLRPRRFTHDEVTLLQLVADRITTAIERARLYEAARVAREQAITAEEAVRVRDEFLSIAAHELKTPLTGAKTAAQLLRRTFRGAALTPTQTRALDMVESQVTKLARLVTHLLDTVRLHAGVMTLETKEDDLAALVRTVVAQQIAPDHEFVLSLPDTLVARIDALRIEQVITNLLDNAVKYTPSGGRIDVSLVETASTAVLAVRDRGMGVPPEHRAKLFDRFYQAHRNRSGMGLGLYISRQIVEQHGGTIYAEFPSDGGSRFVVSLPLR